MFSGFLESVLFFKQFFFTGFAMLVLAGIGLSLIQVLDFPERWVHSVIGVLALLMGIAPHGWRAAFGSSDYMVYYMTQALQVPTLSEGTLFQADMFGVLVGCGIAYAAYFYFANRHRW